MTKPLFVLLSAFLFSGWLNVQAQPHKSFGINNASDSLPKGLEVGQAAPNFTLSDASGKSYELKSALNKPLILVFYRGSWCPHCSRYLSRLEDSLELIQNAGAMIWAITPETYEYAEKMSVEMDSKFPILADRDEAVMKMYDLIFEVTKAYQNKISVGKLTSIEKYNGQEEAHLPVPATFVVDVNQQIIYRHFEYDYKKRGSVKEMLEVLSK